MAAAFEVEAPLVEWALKALVSTPASVISFKSHPAIVQDTTGL